MKTNFNYTRVPAQLIYRYRTNLDDFGVEEPLTLNNCIYEILYKDLSGMWNFEDLAEKFFNIAYYICTVTLIDSHPYTLRPVFSERTPEAKQRQRSYFFRRKGR